MHLQQQLCLAVYETTDDVTLWPKYLQTMTCNDINWTEIAPLSESLQSRLCIN